MHWSTKLHMLSYYNFIRRNASSRCTNMSYIPIDRTGRLRWLQMIVKFKRVNTDYILIKT